MSRLALILKACLVHGDDLRSPAAHAAFQEVVARRQEGVVLSIGGGPTRPHPALTNLNIVRVENVEVLGSAYYLPFSAASVAAIHCEAVLEHLEFPDAAVAEMFRVLKPGGLVFAATPFLQAYHAYPDHFQNFTMRGHVRLFERAAFTVVGSGTCVGPVFALVDLLAGFGRELLPTRVLSRSAERLARILGRPLRLIDAAMARQPRSSMLCSTTFVLARKDQ